MTSINGANQSMNELICTYEAARKTIHSLSSAWESVYKTHGDCKEASDLSAQINRIESMQVTTLGLMDAYMDERMGLLAELGLPAGLSVLGTIYLPWLEAHAAIMSELYGDLLSQYRSECALYGDAGPGQEWAVSNACAASEFLANAVKSHPVRIADEAIAAAQRASAPSCNDSPF